MEPTLDKLTLTIDQIKDLAEFAGLRIEDEITDEDKETEITITTCPKQGIEDDDGSIVHYRHIAYLEEYPEEGVFPLGQRLVSNGRNGLTAENAKAQRRKGAKSTKNGKNF